MKQKNNKTSLREITTVAGVIFLELMIMLLLFFPITGLVTGDIGENVTVPTQLDIGNVFPEIINVTFEGAQNGIDLTANATTLVNVTIVARDFNGFADIVNITAEFFDTVTSSYGDSDDNNYHYTNNSCTFNSTGTFEVTANCIFDVWYYAYNSTWNVTVLVEDQAGLNDTGTESTVVNSLIAIGLPDLINYGTVNATEVSDEQIANVTNFGNRAVNLSLEGYAVAPGDGWAMNCTLGTVGNISVFYEKYNLTASTPGTLNLAQFENNYTNLTTAPVIRQFGLSSRENDTAPLLDDTNSTFWRIYVPLGVAGTCTGNIVFGATLAPGT